MCPEPAISAAPRKRGHPWDRGHPALGRGRGCPRSRPGWRQGLVLLSLLLFPLAAPASEVDVRLAYARTSEGSWLVTTRVDIDLDAEAEQLVREGLRLKFEVEFAVARPRTLMPSKKLAEVTSVLYLEYDSEAARFIVSSPLADARAEFATMFSALRKIGYLTGQPLIEEEQLEPGQAYLFSVQARVSPDDSTWWQRNVAGRLGIGLILSSQTYTWSVSPPLTRR